MEGGEARSARWLSESGTPPPKCVVIADDYISADDAYGLACQGTALLWRGDFQNARRMLLELGSRADRRPRKPKIPDVSSMHGSIRADSPRIRRSGCNSAAPRLAVIVQLCV
jgi:hypothetical protein